MKKFFAVFIFVFFLSGFVRADEIGARQFINDSGYALIDALGGDDLTQKYKTLDDLFDNRVDTDYIAKFVLGPYYNKMSDKQKSDYHAFFKRYIKSLYKSYPLNFDTTAMDFEIISVGQNKDFYDVKCMVDLPEKYQTENLKQVGIEFRLREKSNTIKLIDFKIDGVSMLITFKNKFMQMIKDDEEEIDWFLEDFEDLTLSNESQMKNHPANAGGI